MKVYAGIDIGGTKTTTILAREDGHFYAREQFPTTVGTAGWQPTVEKAAKLIREYSQRASITALGISCGGPLDTHKGLILSPPNLPGWDQVPIVELVGKELGLPIFLENDANAGVLAEWKFGAGRDYRNIVFLTFGTGLGAGLVLDGRLYTGTNDLAGEVGHIRLAAEGPVGYYKQGSFEGFCSGGGLARLMASELRNLATGSDDSINLEQYKNPEDVTGQDVVRWAKQGDPIALGVVESSGTYLGRGLAILIDTLNPEIIIIGSMGVRLGDMLLEPARRVIGVEALPGAAQVCRIVPSALGERIGDYAPLCVALYAEDTRKFV